VKWRFSSYPSGVDSIFDDGRAASNATVGFGGFSGGALKSRTVLFESGAEALRSYWGYLRHGGLVLERADGHGVGDEVALTVQVGVERDPLSLTGRYVADDAAGRQVLAFLPGQPHDVLLSQAMADAELANERAYPRFPLCMPAKATWSGGMSTTVTLMDLSQGGCGFTTSTEEVDQLPVGTPLEVRCMDFELVGSIVWASYTARGMRFFKPS